MTGIPNVIDPVGEDALKAGWTNNVFITVKPSRLMELSLNFGERQNTVVVEYYSISEVIEGFRIGSLSEKLSAIP